MSRFEAGSDGGFDDRSGGRSGGDLLYWSAPLASCPSTQDLCRALVLEGAPEGTAVRALEQTAGRGRGERTWHSPPGAGLWMSFILRPRIEGSDWPALTAVVALSAAEALEDLAEAGAPGWKSSIKWPNDLYGRGGKLGGILAEAAGDAVVIGIGVNLAQSAGDFPAGLSGRASSLRLEGFDPVPGADALARALDRRLARRYRRFQEGDREDLRAGLRARFQLRNALVRVEGPGWSVEGKAVDVGDRGELILQTAEGRRSVLSGEAITLRSATGSV